MGLLGMWPRARLPQLGPPFRAGGQHSARVSHVPDGWSLCAAVAGLWGSLLRGHRCTNACLCAMRTCVFGEVRQVLGGDSSASRHPRLPRRLPLLCHPAQSHSGLYQANLPGPGGLSGRVLLRQRRLDRNANTLWNCSHYFVLCFFSCKPAVERSKSSQVLVINCGFCTTESHFRLFRASCGCSDGHCGTQMWSTLDHRCLAPPEWNTVSAVLPTNCFKQGSSTRLF